jgi:hypothetical protein
MNTTARRIAATTLGSAVALSALLAGNNSANAIQPPPTTTPTSTSTSTTNPTTTTITTSVPNKYSLGNRGTKVGDLASKGNLILSEGNWCKIWGEGQSRIRDFKLARVLHPDDRGRPAPEQDPNDPYPFFGWPTREVVQARLVFCGRNASGLAEFSQPVRGLRIDITSPGFQTGKINRSPRTRQNVVANWLDGNGAQFEGEIPNMNRLGAGEYTFTAVSTEFAAGNVSLTYTVSPGPR